MYCLLLRTLISSLCRFDIDHSSPVKARGIQSRSSRLRFSPLKAAGEVPTAPKPAELNLNPPSGDVAEGAAVVAPPDVEEDIEAEGSAKENCGADGAAGRVDGAEKEKVGAGVSTGGGAGAGVTTMRGVSATLA